MLHGLANLIAVGLFSATVVRYIVLQQWRIGYRTDFDWPQHFTRAHWPTMAARALLGVEVLVEAIRGGWRREL